MWLSILWIVWIMYLGDVDPWGLYSLIVIGAFALIVPVYMLFYSSKHMAVMTRLTPDYEGQRVTDFCK